VKGCSFCFFAAIVGIALSADVGAPANIEPNHSSCLLQHVVLNLSNASNLLSGISDDVGGDANISNF
jgi:hypothetical protein